MILVSRFKKAIYYRNPPETLMNKLEMYNPYQSVYSILSDFIPRLSYTEMDYLAGVLDRFSGFSYSYNFDKPANYFMYLRRIKLSDYDSYTQFENRAKFWQAQYPYWYAAIERFTLIYTTKKAKV